MRTIAHRLAAIGATAVVVAGTALAATPAHAAGAAPVASDNWFYVDPGTLDAVVASVVRSQVSDPEGDPITIVWESAALPGMTLSSDGGIDWQVPADFCGTLPLHFRGSDGTSLSNVATIELWAYDPVGDQILDCSGANTPPVGVADAYSMYQGGSLSIPAAQGVFANDFDPDGDSLAFVAWTPLGLSGETNYPLAGGGFEFVPPADFVGDYVFSYGISDGTDTTSGVPITIQVLPNPAPQPVADEYVMTQGGTLAVTSVDNPLANDVDTNGDVLSMLDLDVDLTGITLSWDMDGDFSFTPPADFTGVIKASYTSTDGVTGVPDVPITITVVEAIVPVVNEVPVANPDNFSVVPGATLQVGAPGVLQNDQDGNGDALTTVVLSTPAIGAGFQLASDGALTWTAPTDFCDSVTFTYAVSDGQSQSEPATVRIGAVDGSESRASEISCATEDDDEPTEPTEPEQPTEPTEPEQPTEPTEPEQPTEPSDPAGPALPAEPTDPTEPQLPTQPLPEVTLTATPRAELAQTGASERLLGDLGATALLALLLGAATLATSARRRGRHAG